MADMSSEKKDNTLQRGAGLLMPISSLPSPYGIGTLGKEAYKFVDYLVDAGQKYWQVLPVGPTSYGDSPYQSFSAFAGNPYFIDLDYLVDEGLITKAQIKKFPWGDNPEYVDYATVYHSRFDILRSHRLLTDIDMSWQMILISGSFVSTSSLNSGTA